MERFLNWPWNSNIKRNLVYFSPSIKTVANPTKNTFYSLRNEHLCQISLVGYSSKSQPKPQFVTGILGRGIDWPSKTKGTLLDLDLEVLGFECLSWIWGNCEWRDMYTSLLLLQPLVFQISFFFSPNRGEAKGHGQRQTRQSLQEFVVFRGCLVFSVCVLFSFPRLPDEG